MTPLEVFQTILLVALVFEVGRLRVRIYNIHDRMFRRK